jgi:23S rRNA (adenine2030-N6)-methyltransferase
MLSYRHGFHAGNWADVHKHAALAMLLARLREHVAPFTVIDVFAGDGVYDLTAAEALKTREFEQGIAKVWRRKDAPASLAPYLDVVRAFNAGGTLAKYPGSPAIARAALRRNDKLVCVELHTTGFVNAKRWAAGDLRVAVVKQDGFSFLENSLPMRGRGLVLIDPSYEVKSDYDLVPRAVERALRRWREAMFVIWYPILPEARHSAMLASMVPLKPLFSEIAPEKPPARGLRGAGLAIFNAPAGFARDLEVARGWLADVLY